MRIVNLTPHEVVIVGRTFCPACGAEESNGCNGYCTCGIPWTGEKRYPSVGVARVAVRATESGTLDGVPVVRSEFGRVEGLPAEFHRAEDCPWPHERAALSHPGCSYCIGAAGVEETVYIVSSIVLAALAGTRQDVVAPDTSPASAVRDADGKIIGVRRWTR